ncbi:MAG: nucleotidyl transferase AbiEii/AbiGii toxin family protein, partial [Pseudomonadota bacterium]
ALSQINSNLVQIAKVIEHKFPTSTVAMRKNEQIGSILKLVITISDATVKIEVNPVLRGSVYESEIHRTSPMVEEQFGFAEVSMLSFDDLYAGKMCAALDRQHPRDLFDIKFLLDNEGISRSLLRAFLVYLISHNRPIAELLNPRIKSIQASFDAEFKGMTFVDIDVETLEQVLPKLVNEISKKLTNEDKEFLLNFKAGKPNWSYFNMPHIAELPAVRWKLKNLANMEDKKREKAIAALKSVF